MVDAKAVAPGVPEGQATRGAPSRLVPAPDRSAEKGPCEEEDEVERCEDKAEGGARCEATGARTLRIVSAGDKNENEEDGEEDQQPKRRR